MNKCIVVFVLMLLGIIMVNAQTNTPIFFKDSTARKNIVGLGCAYENTLYVGISYDRLVKIKNKNVSLGLAFDSPLLLLAQRSKRISVNSSVYLLKSNINIRTQFGLSANFYEDILSKGQFIDANIGLYPGYYKKKYFISGELSYKNNFFTTFHFTNISPIHGSNIIAYNTTGNFYFGANGGVLIKRKLEIKSRIFYNMPRNFKNYAPYTQNIGVNVGVSYWL